MTEEVYKRPMFTMPAYRFVYIVPLLCLSSSGHTHKFTRSSVWLPAAEHAGKVINSGACLCKDWLPCVFLETRRNGGVKTTD